MDALARLGAPIGMSATSLMASLDERRRLMQDFQGYDYSNDRTDLFRQRRAQVFVACEECVKQQMAKATHDCVAMDASQLINSGCQAR